LIGWTGQAGRLFDWSPPIKKITQEAKCYASVKMEFRVAWVQEDHVNYGFRVLQSLEFQKNSVSLLYTLILWIY
jgi:hypothetical protein